MAGTAAQQKALAAPSPLTSPPGAVLSWEPTPPSNPPTFSIPFPTLTPKLYGAVADIASLPSVGTIISSIGQQFVGKIDILVLNGGINARPHLGSASESDIQNSLMENLQWPITLIENLVRQKMLHPNACIVVISSDRVRDPSPGSSIFNAAKAGVGLTDTPGVRALPTQAVEAVKAQRVPNVKVVEGGRMGYAEDVADVVGWLASEKARWVTGSVVSANGGAEYVGGSG
ncbi:NAD(P)-binding protein [Lojkania enalia]|uniref:NAD(P)-binding protein n=1 Tax=Lojkania enalia TaxID=147567 RepID=A0A9P4KCP8_9PLEO|nr:NAD(P)-binding protein [Didymosphaeria enalia]